MNQPKKIQPAGGIKRRGLINPERVRWVTFITVTLCILISAVACILAIWDFTHDGALWRTVATCLVIAGSMMSFGVVNAFYGARVEQGESRE